MLLSSPSNNFGSSNQSASRQLQNRPFFIHLCFLLCVAFLLIWQQQLAIGIATLQFELMCAKVLRVCRLEEQFPAIFADQ
jgi:hypothetical protein